MRWKGSEVQSVLFSRSRWTAPQARAWLRRHGYRSEDLHTTEDYHRFRQSDPAGYVDFRQIPLSERKGIDAVLGRTNPGGPPGTLVETWVDPEDGHTFELYLVGEEQDGWYRFAVYLDDEEVVSVLWPDSDVEAVDSLIFDPYWRYWRNQGS